MVQRYGSFFYSRKGQEDLALGPNQLLYLILIIGLLIILLGIIYLIKKKILT